MALFVTIFLVLCAYYFIKPVRQGWLSVSVLAGLGKMEIKAYSSFAQTLVLLAVIPIYARLTTRWARPDLTSRVGLFFVLNLVIFWLLHPGFLVPQVPYLGVVFYIWTGIFAVCQRNFQRHKLKIAISPLFHLQRGTRVENGGASPRRGKPWIDQDQRP